MSETAILSPINSYLWPIPMPNPSFLPVGADFGITQYPILRVVKGHLHERGIEYCWLDILCLRQPGGIGEQQRLREWEIDVPTIGNIYRHAIIIVRYLNGLGRKVNNQAVAWKDLRHWTNRAWTLQEINHDQMSTPDGDGELNLMEVVGGTHPPQNVRQLLHPISQLAATAHSSRGCGILPLVREIIKRSASNPLDKVAGINYLMWPRGSQFDLPIYNMDTNVEASWLKCVDSMRLELKLELLFLYPNPRADISSSVDIISSKLDEPPFLETITRDIWQGILRDSRPQWVPTWEQLNNFTIDSFWDELRLPTLSELQLSDTRHPLLVPTYMSNLNTFFGTFVLGDCDLGPQVHPPPPSGRVSTHKRWNIRTSDPEEPSSDLHFTGYAPIDTALSPAPFSHGLSRMLRRWIKEASCTSQSRSHAVGLVDFLDLTKVDCRYVLLGLSLDIQAPWLVCVEYMDAMYFRTGNVSFKKVSSIAEGITVYPRTLMLQKVAVLWTDERPLLARRFPQTMPWPVRTYDAIYII